MQKTSAFFQDYTYLCLCTSNTRHNHNRLRNARYHQQKQQNPSSDHLRYNQINVTNKSYLSEVSLISPCGSKRDAT